MELLETQLQQRPFLVGGEFSIADAACFFPLWFAKRVPRLFAEVSRRPALREWFSRIEEFGPGDATSMDAAKALEIVSKAAPADIGGGIDRVGEELGTGDDVTITADDYGRERTRGTVLRLTADEIVVLHRCSQLGDVAVHFPRGGYLIEKLEPNTDRSGAST